MKIIGISRGNQYSPNLADSDAAIFRRTMERLADSGYEVVCCSEKEFVQWPLDKKVAAVVGMPRDVHTLARLDRWVEQGVLVVNSPQGIRNCVRRPMTEMLLHDGVSHPVSWVIELDQHERETFNYPCWIKRGDSHAMVKEDVCYVDTPETACKVLEDFRRRGIASAVVNEHLDGDLVKFYGVMGHPFFHWFYPTAATHSKFGLEAINGDAQGIEFEVELLKALADRAASVLEVPVYGGDAVVTRDGAVKLIDFNDWPSFSPCREEAAQAIADYVVQKLEV